MTSALPDVGVSAEVDKVAFSLAGRGQRADSDRQRDGDRAGDRPRRRDAGGVQAGAGPFRAELVNERRGRFFASYMTKAKEQMKIEIKEDVMRRIREAQQI